ncbi:MAG: helix-turn-helix domain-containing protein [Flavobacteriales bacterium]
MPYIENKIAEGEHQRQDFKYAVNDSRKIAISLCAFANSDGGRLLIGVKDNGTVAGVKPDEEIHMVEAAAEVYCRPVVPFEHHLWKSDNRYVLEVIVEPSADMPHYVIDADGNYKAYIRRADQNLPAGAVLMEVWRGSEPDRPQKYFHTEKEKRIFNALQQHMRLTLSQLVRHTHIPRNVMIKLLARFIRWELIMLHYENDQQLFQLK